MHRIPHSFRASAIALAVLALAGCGSDGGEDPPPVTPATTTDVTVTVIDGAIEKALVCVDKNANDACDPDETHAETDATGHATLSVPKDDVDKYAMLAVVDVGDVDADHGPVTAAYVMSAPPGHTSVISPLTTLVQQTMLSGGGDAATVARAVQVALGTEASLYQDYTVTGADDKERLTTAARLVVLAAQKQSAGLASIVGTKAADGADITQADIDRTVQRMAAHLVDDIAAAVGSAAVTGASGAEREAALVAAATDLVSKAGVTPETAPLLVAIERQVTTVEPVVPAASVQLTSLSFTGAADYNVRYLTSSVAQNTPDANQMTRYVDRRFRSVAGHVATWSAGSDPWRMGDLRWDGTAWKNCPLNNENTSSVRDAQGRSRYTYCIGESGVSKRATFDASGRSMADVYAEIRAARHDNLFVANPASQLGSAKFPDGSKIFYQTNTPLINPIAYYPSGEGTPVGTGNIVSQYSAEVAGGGTASAQPANTGCNSAETRTNGANSTNFESMIAVKKGTPCVFGSSASLTYAGVVYPTSDPNVWYGNSTLNLGKLGTLPLNSGTTAPGYYSGNTLLRLGFTGAGSNAVTYYACKERFSDGSARLCTSVGTGTYKIEAAGDARVMTFTSPPPQAAALTYERVLVERKGHVYYGYRNKPQETKSVRMNTIASNAITAQLGLPAIDPAVPLALTAGSYTGTWDLRDLADTSFAESTAISIAANGNVSCRQRDSGAASLCTLTITNPATGGFTFSDETVTAVGSFDLLAGTASGTYHDAQATPADGSFVGVRR